MVSKWVDMELGDFVELKRGYDLPKRNREVGTVPLISSSGESDFHNIAKVKGPGVITGRYGTIGQVYYVEEDFWPLNTTLYVKDFKGNDPLFVYYFLKTISYSDYSDKAAVPGINRNHLHKAEIRVPVDPIYQRELAEKLWALDSKIELNRQTNQTLEHMAQAIFKSWFVDFEPTRAKIAAKEEWEKRSMTAKAGGSDNNIKESQAEAAFVERAAMAAISGRGIDSTNDSTTGALAGLDQLNPEQIQQLKTTAALFPDTLVDSELGEVPEGWSWSEIGDEVVVAGGGTPSTKKEEYWEGGHIHWTSPRDMSNLTDKILIDTSRKITSAGLAKISSGLLPIDTILMSSRAPVGYLAISKIPVAINQGYIAMKCEGALSAEYVVQWAESVMDDIKQRASGTTFAEISKKSFKIIPVIIPEKEVISAFTAVASSHYEKITEALRETKSLTETRDLLLPKLLSGEINLVG
ncbi:MAG: type I restriction enzyme S subunit [Oleispira sp.]|jgi:type I restriction enzyme S subunit